MSAVAPQRRVVCAAIRRRSDLKVVCGPRHYDKIMLSWMECDEESWANADQGFVDQFGEFLTRAEALAVAREAHQVIRSCGGDRHELFSENLY